MPSLINPYVILGIVLAVLSAFGIGHHQGYAQKENEDQLLIAQKNQEMNHAKEKADDELNKAKNALAIKNDQYVSAVRDGSLRLSIPVASPAGCAAAPTGDGQARAELDGSLSEALIAITNDGDKAITELNSCIDRYNAVKEAAK